VTQGRAKDNYNSNGFGLKHTYLREMDLLFMPLLGGSDDGGLEPNRRGSKSDCHNQYPTWI
jgi:hypothetical protein